ncbi:Flp family type IVb pilin [Paraburkholderia sp. SIMBA_054]|uniref:Flp family type IVb pilin n=1 Tax=Paraburkholderia sp. SIMBA_054 TaxID=3085795 RepID=UPI00397D88BE
MHALTDITKALIRGDDGVTAIEYALLGALIAIAIVASVLELGNSVSDLYQRIEDGVVSALS